MREPARGIDRARLALASFIASSIVGLIFTGRAGKSVAEYFTAGRSLPWWLSGTSMVATTFAADTPLAVTALVAQHGIAGNWVWWNMVAGGMLTVFFYARLWRRANVKTDAELTELRYAGRSAAVLRGFRALYLALPKGMEGPLPKETERMFAGCASCHGKAAAPHFEKADAAALASFGNRFAPTTSALFGALSGKKNHPVALRELTSLEGRALFAWMSGEAMAAPKRMPSLPVFRAAVLPLFVRRGCSQSTCHGSVGSGLLLPPGEETAVDTYLRLLPRIADGSFWPKVTNGVAHGGGLVLGAKDDCVAQQVEAWLKGSAIKPCKPRPPPSEAIYAEVVQPAFESLKCTGCHKKGVGGMTLSDANGDAAIVHSNWLAVQPFIDLDFPPVSHVLLRVREPCLQSRIVSWIAGKPQPTCVVAGK